MGSPRPGSTPERILVVRLGAIGDCLRVVPAVVRLREAFPRASIGWAVGSLAAPLLEGHPALDRLHVVSGRAMRAGPASAWAELRRAGAELAEQRYDVAIDFHTRLKSGYLTRASRARLRIGLDRRSGTEVNFLFTNCHVSLEDRYENRVTRFFRLLAPLGIDPAVAGEPLGLWNAPATMLRARAIFAEAGHPPVLLFAGTSARRSADRWPEAKWRELVRALGEAGLRSMLLWGPGELEVAAAIAGASPSCVLAPPTTLAEMMALAGLFRLYVGTNTAALHMAWMQGVPSVVLAGGRPWRTDRPLGPVPSRMLSAGGAEPARKLRGEDARRAVEGIAVEDVLEATKELLCWSAPRA
jgi:heptosyltransferase-1